MGVCEGPPKSILPDHLGRADYHGASINQAARYMDAAAHGGQVRGARACACMADWLRGRAGRACTREACVGVVGG
jgi:hypothetical protein